MITSHVSALSIVHLLHCSISLELQYMGDILIIYIYTYPYIPSPPPHTHIYSYISINIIITQYLCWLLPIDKMCRSVFSHPLDSFPVSSKRNNLVNPSGNKSLTEGSSYAVTGHSIGGQSLCDFRISSLSLSAASRMQSFAPSSYAYDTTSPTFIAAL